jgi:type II/III secretion system protein
MKKLLIALACTGLLLAQDRVQKVITIKNGNLGAINRTLKDLLPGNAGVLVTNDNEHLVVSGSKEQVAAFEEIIKQLDVPQAPEQNIQTTVYMVVATQAQSSGVMPTELDSVVTQLKSLFPYKGYRLLDSFILRSRSGQGAEASGFVPSAQATTSQMIYQSRFSRATVDASDKGRIIRFNGLRLGMRVPTPTGAGGQVNYLDVGINTDVDVPEGKKVVVGKTSAVEGPDSALILVISAKVVD